MSSTLSYMVDKKALDLQIPMPHFFLTLSANETKSLRWEEVEDIVNIAKIMNSLM